MIRPFKKQDIMTIRDIYNHYVKNTIITFEEEPVTIAEMIKRVNKITDNYPFLVYEKNSQVYGYAYGSRFRKKSAYNTTVESTIYLDAEKQGKGVGTALYKKLIDRLIELDFHTIIGVIALPNEASHKLHQKLGFEKVAKLTEVGYKFKHWVDVEYWELLLK